MGFSFYHFSAIYLRLFNLRRCSGPVASDITEAILLASTCAFLYFSCWFKMCFGLLGSTIITFTESLVAELSTSNLKRNYSTHSTMLFPRLFFCTQFNGKVSTNLLQTNKHIYYRKFLLPLLSI